MSGCRGNWEGRYKTAEEGEQRKEKRLMRIGPILLLQKTGKRKNPVDFIQLSFGGSNDTEK
jgi:hypothetical protein